jgi:hypothetical protein
MLLFVDGRFIRAVNARKHLPQLVLLFSVGITEGIQISAKPFGQPHVGISQGVPRTARPTGTGSPEQLLNPVNVIWTEKASVLDLLDSVVNGWGERQLHGP